MKTNTVIIGSGVIGLSIARELSSNGTEVIILEKENRSGEGISSRNSGVIHSGIYYPQYSNKAIHSVEGRNLLYDYLEKKNISYKKLGKLVISTNQNESKKLYDLFNRGKLNGVDDIRMLTIKEAKSMQNDLVIQEALYCPSTGIFDTADFIQSLEADIQANGGIISFRSEVKDITIKSKQLFEINVKSENNFTLEAENIVNACGLSSTNLAEKIDSLKNELIPKSFFSKGHYFQLNGKHPFNSTLIYPINTNEGLGIHVTLDVSGKVRFGPDTEWIEEIDYSFDKSRKEKFFEAIRTYWPTIDKNKLMPDYTGIRPKIVGPGEDPADFLIQASSSHNIDGLINLFGIESPGLTSSLSIAKKVRKLLNN